MVELEIGDWRSEPERDLRSGGEEGRIEEASFGRNVR